MINIQSIKAYSDNYIWLITTNEGNLVIDPGESQPVINYLQKHSLTLTDILITHHHFDHVGGVLDLKKNILGHKTQSTDRELLARPSLQFDYFAGQQPCRQYLFLAQRLLRHDRNDDG